MKVMRSVNEPAISLKEHLLRLMAENVIPVGAQLPPEKALMRQFGMTRSAVRKVLFELTVDGLIERHQGRGSFRTAARPRPKRGWLIGVWLDWPSEIAFGSLTHGIRDELARRQYHCIIETSESPAGQGESGLETLMHRAIDGFIIAPSLHSASSSPSVDNLLQSALPVVLLDHSPGGKLTNLVSMHYELALDEIVQHLVELGHRRIALVAARGSGLTEKAFERALERHGMAADPQWRVLPGIAERTSSTPTDSDACGIQELLRLELKTRPTALICAESCLDAVVDALRQAGLRIPDNVSVISLEGPAVGSAAQDATITAYVQPAYRIGVQAARLLVEHIQNADAPTSILLQGHLVKRASTAPPPPESYR